MQEKNGQVYLIYMYSKIAFGKVLHDRQCGNEYKGGIQGHLLQWIPKEEEEEDNTEEDSAHPLEK